MLCEAAAYYKAQGKTLIDVLNGLYARFGFYLDTQSNFFFRGADGQKKIAALTAGLRREHPAEVAGARPVSYTHLDVYKRQFRSSRYHV